MKYTKTLKISKEDWERLNILESIEDLNDADNELIDNYDAKQDDCSYTFEFNFRNGNTVTISQYSGSTNYWLDIWFNDECDRDDVVDLDKEIIFEDEDTSDTYICRFKVEK